MTRTSRAHQRALREAYEALLRRDGSDLLLADRQPDWTVDIFNPDALTPKALRASIRYLENQRGYSTWRTVGTEPEADFLYRLATVRQRKGLYLGDRLPHLQRVLDDQATEIRGWLNRQGFASFPEFFVGVFPTGEMNARPVPITGEGVMLLVHAGLMDLIFTVLKTNLATASTGPRDPALLSGEQASMVLAEAFNAYLYGDGSLWAWGMPRLPAAREAPLGYVLRRAEQFVVAHELGHVGAGHLASAPSPEKEFAADRFAVDLVCGSLAREPDAEGVAQFLAGGILTFFAIAAAVESLQEAMALDGRDTGSHPALLERSRRVIQQLRERLPGSDPVSRVGLFAGWLDTHLPRVVAWLRLVDATMRRPGRWE